MIDVSQEIIDIVRIIRSETIGPKTFKHLISLYKTPCEIVKHLPSLVKNGKIFTEKQAIFEIENNLKNNAKFITYLDKDYPQELKLIADAPPIITVKGNIEVLRNTKIAMVGARNASYNACKFANYLAHQLGEHKKTIVSGLARGIDTEAHKGSINSGTIAVIAGGIDNIYPPENKKLFDEIAEKGLIITEHPYGSSPKSENFPQRNRIISALSLAIIVVEATLKSGSLITARFALEHGKEIMAVPGFPLDSRCQGSNHLLKQGAHLIENVHDVLDILSLNTIPKQNSLFKEDEVELPGSISNNDIMNAKEIVLNMLQSTPILLDELIGACNLSISLLSAAIVDLEIEGKIIRSSGNKFSLIY